MLSVALLLSACVCRVSAQVADSAAIVRFWGEYRATLLAGGDRSGYWQSEDNMIELAEYEGSFLKYYFNGRERPYKIERVEALNDSLSVITVFNDSERPREWYKVGVLRQADGYKLVDYFQIVKGDLLRERRKYVDLYSLKPNTLDGRPFDGRLFDGFIEELCALYGFEPDRRIEYFACSDMKECFHAAGLGFGGNRYLKKLKGLAMFKTLVFSEKYYHPHELVHAVLVPKYPAAPPPLPEGLAVYHSKDGVGEHVRAFKWHVKKAREKNYELTTGQMASMSGAGFLLVDHVLKNHGPRKMLALMSYSDLDEMLEKELGVPCGESSKFFIALLEAWEKRKSSE